MPKKKKKTTTVQIVLPEQTYDLLSIGLMYLTRALEAHGCEPCGGGMGGRFGYGCDFENDTFMMHHFCWCERQDCPWCVSCECEGHWNTVDGKYEQNAVWILDKKCYRCVREDNGEDTTPAPNFEHKPSGLKVRWYKYIGRDMEVSPEDLTIGAWQQAFADCLHSLGASGTLEDAVDVIARQADDEARTFQNMLDSINT